MGKSVRSTGKGVRSIGKSVRGTNINLKHLKKH